MATAGMVHCTGDGLVDTIFGRLRALNWSTQTLVRSLGSDRIGSHLTHSDYLPVHTPSNRDGRMLHRRPKARLRSIPTCTHCRIQLLDSSLMLWP